MTRAHRTRHFLTWLVLLPLCVLAVAMALRVREPRASVPVSTAAEAQPGAPR
jgi:hypothetical protein